MASHREKLEKKIVEDVETCFKEIYGNTDLELVDVEYNRESSGWVLRVYIDKEGGVLLDDCSMISNQLGDIIDIKDIIPGSYSLEVTSPGVNRPLKKKEDFISVIGETIKLKTRAFLNKRKNFKGVLKEFKDGVLKIDSDGKEFNILYKNVKKANLEYDFNKKNRVNFSGK